MAAAQRSQKVDDTDGGVLIFGAHVPNLLIQRSFQTIFQGQNQCIQPFIERFEGSLLFVDISGFTALSRRLHIELLKTHINAYFTEMLNVVDQHEGDAVKFAGDALYIIWPANAKNTVSACVQKALECSLEITRVCNSYKIYLDDQRHTSSSYASGNATKKKSPSDDGTDVEEDAVMFLNVHVGLGVGIMAAVDVGCSGRWEMLLVGEPLNDVAKAELYAESGEVVISGKAYAILKADGAFDTCTNVSSTLNCASREDDCYLVWRDLRLLIPKFSNDETDDGSSPKNRLDFLDGILKEIHSARHSKRIGFSLWKAEDYQSQRRAFMMTTIKAHVHEAARSTAVVDLSTNLNAIPRSNRSSMTSASTSTLSEIDSEISESRNIIMENELKAAVDVKLSSPNSSFNRKNYPSPGTPGDPSFPTVRKSINSSSRSQSPTSKDSKRPVSMNVTKMVMILTAELRNCTILFINIEVDVSLIMSSSGIEKKMKALAEGHFQLESLPFIARSSDEVEADENLLGALQNCMEVTSTSLNSNGGQIRQFICDDKGIVCIGTIGLRGSTTDDNSAAAVEAASSIIAQLQATGLNARIGIASGKAYCGLVGSSVRHEYAVMGPCVNLSARLMCAAAAGTILCDEKTRKTDRQHKYIAKSAIAAKGYDAPVSIFMPLLAQGRVSSPDGMSAKQEQKSTSSSAPPSPSTTNLQPAVSGMSLAAARDLTHDASTSSDDEGSEGSAGEILPDAHECNGQSGRLEILHDIFTFASTSSSASKSDIHMSKRTAGTSPGSGPGILQETANNAQPKVQSDTKMKIIFVSGPYGIGKSYVLRAAHNRLHTTHSHTGGIRYKFHVQASNYTKTSLFFTWKKIVSNLLTRLQLQGSDSHSYTDGKQSSAECASTLSPIPEHQASTSSRMHADKDKDRDRDNNVNESKARILHTTSLLKGIKKQELLQRNIRHLISLLEPSYKEFEPLLMNGFLCSISMEHSDATKNLSWAEKLKPITQLLAALIQKIADLLSGSLLFIIDDIQSMDHASWGLLRLMWKRNTCVTVVCSFRTFGAQSINYESEPVTSNPIDPKGMEISLENELATSFINDDADIVKGEKRDRVLVIELPPLNEDAIAALALRLLRGHNASFEIDAKMLTVVHRLSGGNPLYAVEVSLAAIRMVDNMKICPSPAKLTAREVAHAKFNLSNKSCGRSRFDDELDARGQDELKNPIKSPWEKAFMKVSSSLRSDRIEEIVIFRFDQLDSKSQLLLRIAAVAGYNNAPFSVEMLVYILPHFSSARTQDELFEQAKDDDDDESDFEFNTTSDSDVELKAGRAIIRALTKILRDSEFLRVCKSSNDSIDDIEIESGKFSNQNCEIDTSSLNSQSFEFVSSLVQATVLNLNLRAQNAILHFQTASYIESQITPRLQASKSNTQLYLMAGMDSHSWSSNSFLSWFTKSSCSPSAVSSATWYRMGIHWQHSSHFVKAMACFYNSAVLLESIGSSRDGLVHLFKAYDMLEILRNEAECTTSETKDAYVMMSRLSSRMGDTSHSKPIPLSPNTSSDIVDNVGNEIDFSELLTREDIHRIFQGDILALDIAIKLLITLSQNIVVTLAQRKERDTKYYSESLEIAIASCRELQTISCNKMTSKGSFECLPSPILMREDQTLRRNMILNPLLFDISDTAEDTQARGAFGSPEGSEESQFYLNDFTSIFPILAGLTLRLLHGTQQDESMIQKVDMMTKTYLALARQHGDSMHIIRALHLQSIFYSRINRLRESMAICDEIKSLYVFEEHSFQMSKVYGGDRGICAMATAAVGNALLGKWSKALTYCENTERYLTRLTSVSVLGLSTHSLAIAYGLLGMHDRAHALFTSLMETEGRSSAFSIFRELNPFYNELYAKRSELAIAGREEELQQAINSFTSNYQDEDDDEDDDEDEIDRLRLPLPVPLSQERILSPGKVEAQELVLELEKTSTQNVTADNTASNEKKGVSHGLIRGLQVEIDRKKNVHTPTFSSVVEAIIKKIRANKLIARVMKEKQAVKLNNKATAEEGVVEGEGEGSGLGVNGVCEGAPCAASIPKTPEAQGTISFQLSLMTGRGMDSVKAELCMLNALIALGGGTVSSNLNNTSKILTIEEHCEDGLRCISNIFEDSNHSQISYYAHTCDQVHSYIVEARLYTILATLAPTSHALHRSNQQDIDVDLRRLNQSHPQPEPQPHDMPVTAAGNTSLRKTKTETNHDKDNDKVKDKQYYVRKAVAAMKKCEALGRTLDAPGVLFTTGIQMAVMGLDIERGKSILSESIDIIEYQADITDLDNDRQILNNDSTKHNEKQSQSIEENQIQSECHQKEEVIHGFIIDEEEEEEDDDDNEEDEGEVTVGIRDVFDILTETKMESETDTESTINSNSNSNSNSKSRNQDSNNVRIEEEHNHTTNTTKKELKPSNKKMDDFKYLKKKSSSFEISQIPIVSYAREILRDYKK